MVPTEPHPDASIVSLSSTADLEAARVMARELCNMLGVRNYHAQTVVGTVGGLGAKIVAEAKGRLTLRVDPDTSKLFVSVMVAAGSYTEEELTELSRAAHHVRCEQHDGWIYVTASFDYERLRQ